ncbi:MAG: SpoIIE family protein phosphatase [Flavobacteriales bacterium]|nr:SpoIIE family protein phosphatase [Flavobacteriales bacterium]
MTAVLLLRGNRIKQKANQVLHKANVQIEAQRDKIQLQKDHIEEINNDITDSIHYAKQLQDSILPSDERMRIGIGEVFVYFRPRDIVSGDFYWYHETDKKIFIAAADCTGHGVPGAFVSMVCQSVLNKVVIEDEVHVPGEILSKAHQGVVSTFKKESSKSQANDGMDIALTVWDKETNVLHYAGAMNPLFIVREGELIEYKGDRRGIGGIASREFDFITHSIQLKRDDMIYIFSDGYQDQFGGPKGKKFMVKKLKRLIQEFSTEEIGTQKEMLHNRFEKWLNGHEQIDDVLMIGYRIT